MKHILVLGAGFGGLRTAKKIAEGLRRLKLEEKYELFLVDKNDHHTYTPLLYEVATTSKTTANLYGLHEVAAYKIQSLTQNLPIKFIKNRVNELDAATGVAYLEDGRSLRYDFLVFAPGSEINYFGIKGLQENSIPLKEFSDAIRLRDEVWKMAEGDKKEIKVVVGGGGSTGVELAGELKIWCGELEKEYRGCRLQVSIIEAAPTVLAGFPENIIKIVNDRLRKLDVKIISGKKISEARKGSVVLKDGEKIPFDVLVWAGGVKASGLLSQMPFSTDKGRAMAEEKMLLCLSEDFHLHLRPTVYGVGDSICFYNPLTKRPVPGVARAAILQANVAAHNLLEEIKHSENQKYKPVYKKYKPLEYPYIIPVGGKWAVAKIGPFVLRGFLGWIFKGLVELNYLFSIMPPWKAVKIWLKGLWIFIKNDRLG